MAVSRARYVLAGLLLALVGLGAISLWHRAGYYPTLPVSESLDRIELPAGFHIEVYAEGISAARSMTLGAKGTVFVGSTRAGKVYALVDRRHQGHADVITIARGLDKPNGVAFHDGALYVAEVTRILRYDGIEDRLDNPPKPAVINSSLPEQYDHENRFIGFGPDGWLYIGVGAPCNICEPKDPFATIMRMHSDGSGLEVFARGIRNTVGFDWQPQSKDLWFTENGRDLLGDDIPPDELNRASRAGMNFGYPYCHGGFVKDPEFGQKHACSEFTPPALKLPAHVASLGMRFYTGEMFPPAYRNQIFIAEHGSWNRSTPIGDRISLAKINGDKVTYEIFAEGWQVGRRRSGRPVDVLVASDGALLVSDDQAGVVYRISYK